MKNQKIAFVTGGTGGIGTAICIGLAQQGRRVVAGYYPPEQEAAEQPAAEPELASAEAEVPAVEEEAEEPDPESEAKRSARLS